MESINYQLSRYQPPRKGAVIADYSARSLVENVKLSLSDEDISKYFYTSPLIVDRRTWPRSDRLEWHKDKEKSFICRAVDLPTTFYLSSNVVDYSQSRLL